MAAKAFFFKLNRRKIVSEIIAFVLCLFSKADIKTDDLYNFSLRLLSDKFVLLIMSEKKVKNNLTEKNEPNQNAYPVISDKKFLELLLKSLENPQVQRKILKIVLQAKRNGELN